MASCLIGLGSNQGNRQHLLETAAARIVAESTSRFIGLSSWYETAAVGGPSGQPKFLNGVLAIETSLSPQQLLTQLQQLEHALGRRREERWAQRPIDLDLLLHDDVVLHTSSLQLPHPRMAWRRFVLEPAAEVAGGMIHPTFGWSISRLLEHLNTTPFYVAITGPIAVGKTHLAGRLAEILPAHQIVEQPDWGHLSDFYRDPAGHAWRMELEFLDQRARLLETISTPTPDVAPSTQVVLPTAPEALPHSPNDQARRKKTPWTISDFWYDQSRAFARAWLKPERLAAFDEQWRQKRCGVARPKLLVLLDAPAKTLLARLRSRGRACEQLLTEETLERIRQAILDEVRQPDVGPVLQVSNEDPAAALTEVLAAVQAME
jgi:2-amino-4-hydroxy-6-hydroxymethyldihydropteridine diphosphokinase